MTSEKVVAQATKPIASGPAFSWIRRDRPLRWAADCGSDWDVSKNLLAWVAGAPCPANGAQLNGFYIDNFSTMQGAVYTVCDYGEGNNTTFWGPVISRQVYIQNSTTNFYVPIGTPLPGMPATYDQVQQIVPEPGSWSS